jgi:hypothetical protein
MSVLALILLSACGQAERTGPSTNTSGGDAAVAGGTAAGSNSGGASGGSAGFINLPGSGATRGRGLAQDTRADPPSWLPPIALGASGWQSSAEPFCDTSQKPVTSLGIWADQRGVFVSMTAQCPRGWCEDGAFALQFNDGSGWRVRLTDSTQSPVYPSTNRLSGWPQGPVVLLDYTPFDFAPSVTATDSVIFVGTWDTTVQPRLGALDGAAAVAAYGVGPDHGYVLVQENSDPATSSVHEYASGTWRKLAVLPTKAYAIWADGETVLVAGAGEGVYRRVSAAAEFERIAGVPAGDYFSVWAFADSDVWVGSGSGQLVHFDGASWKLFSTRSEQPIQRLWGSDQRLFYISNAEFGRADQSGIEVLIRDGSGLRFWDLWGRTKAEVFLTVTDSSLASFRCGEKRALWYDGAEFHRF